MSESSNTVNSFYTPETRERIWADLVAAAESDPEIVGAAAVGSSATGRDRWSDLDLTLGVAASVDLDVVKERWTRRLVADEDAIVLFDISAGETDYRVFLFPGALQVDVSFSPAHAFGPRGPSFHLLFGEPVTHKNTIGESTESLVGIGVHHCIRAHICLERGRVWQALHWTNELRELAMVLACRRLELDESHGRGFDQMPQAELNRFAEAIPHEAQPEALRSAIRIGGSLVLDEGERAGAIAPRLRERLAPILVQEDAKHA